MKYTDGVKRLDLPDLYRFGIELEAYNVHTGIPTKDKPSLYMSAESNLFLKEHRWKKASIFEEALVGEGGAELVSPILYDKEADWQNLLEVCEHMKKYPGSHGQDVVADSKCGCHVHFDARCLTGKNLEETEKIMSTFLRFWAESEELIYKMCNDVGQPIRAGTLTNTQKGLNRLCMKLQHIKGMASSTGKKIMKSIEKGTLKVSYKKFGALKRAIAKGKLDNRRYHGLNLTNIGNPDKNTIEFRMSNGTLNPDVIKKNVHLYASVLETSRTMALNPEKLQEQSDQFYRTDVNEQEKVQNFLNLVFDNEDDKKIYMERWESVKDAPVFTNNEKDFLQGRFKREEFKTIAKRTPAALAKEAYGKLKEMATKNKSRGEEKEKNDEPEL